MSPVALFHTQWVWRFLGTIPLVAYYLTSAVAQVHAQAAPITSSGLNTQVAAPISLPGGNVQYDITGGTRPGNGANLFHGFGEFGVPTNNVANFLNDAGLSTSNILGRVTGGNPSNIFGTIQTTGFGNANLFLMNPAGIVFGPNAALNVGGSVNFTTADYIRLTDGVQFTAIPGAQDALLSAAPVAAFGFLGLSPAGITVQGSNLSVPSGQSISLVAGDMTIEAGTLEDTTTQPAHLFAPGGEIRVTSVASPGEVLHPTLDFAPNIDGQTFSSMGTITVSGSATIEVSGDAAGAVRIRGGRLVMSDSTISADTGSSNGNPVAVDINLTGGVSISSGLGLPAITARSTGAGDAGEVRIASANFQATSTSSPDFPTTLIDSHNSGDGRAGNVSITIGDLNVVGPSPEFSFIDSGPQGAGRGGDVSIMAQNISFKGTALRTGTQSAEILGLEPNTSAGNITLTADTLDARNIHLDTHTTSALADNQAAGDITLNVRDIHMIDAQVFAFAPGRGGAISINADTFVTDFSTFDTQTFFGAGGGITLNARMVELTNGSSLLSSTSGDGKAGDINVTASDHLSLRGHTPENNPLGIFRPSGLFSNSFGDSGGHGDAGNITVNTPRLEMTEGGRINTSTASGGRGGNVTLNVAGLIAISGEFTNPEPEPIFAVGPIKPSGIITTTVGADCAGPCGDAGHISMTTGSLNMAAGAQINSGTSNVGRGGDITIHATGPISIAGTLSDGSPAGIFSRSIGTEPGSGQGGNISVAAVQSVALSNGSSISASSTGPGNAGDIFINAGQTFQAQNSSITTQSTEASGGNITIMASNSLQLSNSEINTSVFGPAGTVGGDITIDPQFVTLQNSQILAQANAGQGGNITITAGVFLQDATSVISASAQSGINGTVTIQSPVSNLSANWARLQQSYLEAAALLRQRCAAKMSTGSSSLVLAGRDRIPLEPGSWLSSPVGRPTSEAGTGVAFSSGDSTFNVSKSSRHNRDGEFSIRRYGISPVFHSIMDAGCTP